MIGIWLNIVDIEMGLVIYELMLVIGIEFFKICVNNCKVFNGFFEKLGFVDKLVFVLWVIDKFGKIGFDVVEMEIWEVVGVSEIVVCDVMKLCELEGLSYEFFV